MEPWLKILLAMALTLCLGALVRADTDWSTSQVTYAANTKSDSYWNTGSEVAVYLFLIPLLLIPLLLIGLKIAERGGEWGGADGHYESHAQGHHKRAFKAVSNAFLNQLTKRVLDAIKVRK